MGYNAVADTGLSSFVLQLYFCPANLRNPTKFSENSDL